MRLYQRNEAGVLDFETLTTEGVAFDYNEADEKTVFVAKGSGNVTVVAGGPQGTSDCVITLTGSESVFTLDSLLFKHGNGANKGKVVLKGSNIEVAVIALP